MRLGFIFALDLRNREFDYFQLTHGLLGEQTWLADRHVVLINHSFGLGRQLFSLWNHQRLLVSDART